MSSGNTIVLIGNVTRDPELSYTPSGIAKAAFGLAVNRRWQNRQTQDWEENTSFFDVVCWREMAENASESLPKGTRVIVTGRLDQRSWETPDGEHRYKIEITADEVGPSLRWATAQIVKNERREPSGGREAGSPEPSSSRRNSHNAPSPKHYTADEPNIAHYDESEEPF
ncbi:MAG: single-stranded DNA-binding protein [Acidimicrobiales bacterium]